MKSCLLMLAAVFLLSCNGSKTSESTLDSAAYLDSIAAEIPDSNASVKIYNFVLSDTSWQKTSLRNLSKKEIDLLFPLEKLNDESIKSYIQRYFELDSISRKIKSNDFDIGTLVSVKIKFMDTLSATMEYTLVSSIIEFSSYEACPYFSGTKCILHTFDSNGKFLDATLGAEKSSGGDPPAWGSTFVYSTIFSNGKITRTKIEQSGEDETGTESIYSEEGSINSEGKFIWGKMKKNSEKPYTPNPQ